MATYGKKTEKHMQALYKSLSEKDRRRYAAVEAEKLGQGGASYISRLLGIDPKTLQRGLADLDNESLLEEKGERKKGVDEKANSTGTLS